MNKFLKTYIRARTIVTNFNIDFNEILIDNLFSTLKITVNEFKYMKELHNKLLPIDIAVIVGKFPDLINLFYNRLGELEGYDIYVLLLVQPQFIKYFIKNLHTVDYDDKMDLIGKHPELKQYFDE